MRVSILMSGGLALACAGVAHGALPPPPAGVQVTTEYGQEFVTVTHAGNRYANQAEAPRLYEYTPPALWAEWGTSTGSRAPR